MSSPESFSGPTHETEVRNFDAAEFHGKLIDLLCAQGEAGGDAFYFTVPREYDPQGAVISNYMTRLVHTGYRETTSQTDPTQKHSLSNKDAVIDIQFGRIGHTVSYSCFMPADIDRSQAHWLGLTPARLDELPQAQFVILGSEGLIDAMTDRHLAALAELLFSDSEAA